MDAESSVKPLGGRGSAPNPTGELSRPKILRCPPLDGEEGLAAPSLKPNPVWALRA